LGYIGWTCWRQGTCTQAPDTRPIFLCCPARFDGTTLPGCDTENPDEVTSAGACSTTRLLRRTSAHGGDITCAYAPSGDLVGTQVLAGRSMVMPFCMTSRMAIAGEELPAACLPNDLPIVRGCTP